MGTRVRGGAAAFATIALVFGLPAVAQAKAGDILAGTTDGAVVRITPAGGQSTVVSDSPLESVGGLDFAASGTLFEADYSADEIITINPRAGTATTLVDDPSLFGEPLDVEVGPDKRLYVAEESFGTIVRVNPKTGDAAVLAPQGDLLDDPYALSVTPRGTIFVADNDGQVLRVDSRSGDVSLVAEIPGSGPQGIEQTPRGLLYVMDESEGIVYSVDPRTGVTDEVAGDSDLAGSYNIALETRGTLVVATANAGTPVLRVDPKTGAVTEVAGGEVGNVEGIAVEPPKCKGKLATIVGSQKKDKLKGSKFADVIVGLNGNDKIDGGKGKDRICGGKGKDKLKGGKGRDKVDGGPGKDREQQ